MDMNRSFPEWYRTANAEPAEELLKKRWQGIEGYCENDIGSHEILELIRLFFQGPVDPEFRKSFVDTFYQIDNAFPEKNNLELSVLAGTTLVHVLENFDEIDNLVVLAVLSASFNKSKISIPDILTKIKDIFACKTSGIREDVNTNVNFQSGVPSHKKLFEKLNAAKTDAALWNATEIGEALSTYVSSLNKYLTEVKNFAEKNSSTQCVYQEDSQILWWMAGEWSRDMQKPFRSFETSEACIVIGKELADLIKHLPGPYASNAVLSKILSILSTDEAENITLSTAINKLDKTWRQQVLETYSAEKTKEITPLLSAISVSLDVDGATEWKPAYKKLTGFDPSSIKMSAIKLAYQMYLECLVIKSM